MKVPCPGMKQIMADNIAVQRNKIVLGYVNYLNNYILMNRAMTILLTHTRMIIISQLAITTHTDIVGELHLTELIKL